MFLATVISGCAAAAVKRDLKNVSPHIISNYAMRTRRSSWNERTNCTININCKRDRRRPTWPVAGVCRSRDLDRFGAQGHRNFLVQRCDRNRALRNAHYRANSGSYVSYLSVSSDREGLARNAQPRLHYKRPSYYYNSMYLP